MSTAWLAQPHEHRAPAEHLRQLLLRNAELRAARHDDPVLAERVAALRTWRADHAIGLVPAGAAEQAAGHFLIDQLLASRDFETRDEQLEKGFSPLARLARGSLLRAAADAIELHVNYQEFDHRVVETLFDTMGEADLTDAAIGDANRLINDYRRRMRQLELLRLVGKWLTAIARSRSARAGLATARIAARPFGTHVPLDVVAEGADIFAALPDPAGFMHAFIQAQGDALDRMHAGGDPFDASAELPTTASELD